MTFIQRVKRKLLPPREVVQGYENPELVETIFLKTINYNPDSDWPLVAGINTVLDFGGGAGLHYKVARRQCPDIRWAVVETPAMVRRAKELGTDRLMFFERIDQAADWPAVSISSTRMGPYSTSRMHWKPSERCARFGRQCWHGTAFRSAKRPGERFRPRT